jgi:WD40 repeat protein
MLRRLSRIPLPRVAQLAWSPDGALLAAATDQAVCVLALVGTELHRVADIGHPGAPLEPEAGSFPGAAWSVAFSPDGQTLASGHGYAHDFDGYWERSRTADSLVRVWRTRDRALLHTLVADDISVEALAVASDGTVLAGRSTDVLRWRAGGEPLAPLAALRRRWVASPANGELPVLDATGLLRRLRLPTLDPSAAQRIADEPFVALSDNGRVALSTGKGTVRIWHIDATPAEPRVIPDQPRVLALSPDGSWFAGVDRAEVTLRSATDGRRTARFVASSPYPRITFSAGGALLGSTGHRAGVFVHALPSGALARPIVTGAMAPPLAFSRDGAFIAYVDAVGTLCVAPSRSAGPIERVGRVAGNATEIAFRSDAAAIAVGTAEGEVELRSRRDGARLGGVSLGRPVQRLHFGEAGMLVAYAASDRPDESPANLCSVDLAEPIAIPGGVAGATAIAAAASSMAAVGGYDGRLTIWRLHDAMPVREVIAHRTAVRSLSWRADGAQIASASDAGEVALWSMPSLALVRRWSLAAARAVAAFVGGGASLAAASGSALHALAAGSDASAVTGALEHPAASVAVHPRAAWIAVGTAGGVELWSS